MGCIGSKEDDSDLNFGDSYAPLMENQENRISRSESTTDFDQQSRSGSRRAQNYGLETLLLQLQQALTWRRKYINHMNDSKSIAELRSKVHELLSAATVEMGNLTQAKRYAEADDVVDGILRLKNSLGDELLDAADITAFVREVCTIEDFVLTGGQYFKPMMVKDDDDNVLKIFFFLISDVETRKTMFRYYVEHTSLIEDFFALVFVTTAGHNEVEMYGNSCPSYWEIRRDVIRDVQRKLQSLEDNM